MLAQAVLHVRPANRVVRMRGQGRAGSGRYFSYNSVPRKISSATLK
jgi:hypothetical protein